MSHKRQLPGKIAYGLAFTVILPAFLFFWASRTEGLVRLPNPGSFPAGIALLLAGAGWMLWGMWALAKHGKGLPMNAFPPPRYVSKGPYRFIRHPIYWGFGTAVVGVCLVTGSSSGLWLVSPLVILGMVALVTGFEDQDLARRFPGRHPKPVLDIPPDDDGSPLWKHRLASSFWFVFSSMLTCGIYNSILPEGFPTGALVSVALPESPLLLILAAVPWSLKRNGELRAWLIGSCLALFFILYLSVHLWAFGWMTMQRTEVLLGFNVEAQPIWHVTTWVLGGLCAYWCFRAFTRFSLGIGAGAMVWIALDLDPSVVSVHRLFFAGVLLVLGIYHFQIWMGFRELAEKLANSWREWVWGPVRVINHGIYAGLGAFIGILLSGWLAGPAYAWAILQFALVVIVFSALWAQVIEGGEKLKRPFGYYGALVGIAFAGALVWFQGFDVCVVIGVISVVMPWVQAIGRLRCLVNGCCHGKPTDREGLGIRYFHERSRVCGISHLCGQSLHPTPLYAILWLLPVGLLLLALWENDLSPTFIFGMYLILTGLGRFVEEAYRGEVQTPVIRGLRLYQWTAIASVFIGICFTMIPVEIPHLDPGNGWDIWISASLGGLFTFFAMGVDFPKSNARFSRLV